ncbi:MAG: F0F1 ATP synthase subunit delta [Sphingomonadaceae bacterium]
MLVASRDTTGLAGRYAAALFDLAETDKALDATERALATLEEALNASDDLRKVISDVRLSRAEMGATLAAIADQLELPDLVRRFLGVLAANGRASALPDVIAAFRRQLAAHRGEATAEVVAAHKLTAAQHKALAAKLKARTGRDMQLAVTVDPSILGGLIVRIGSEQIDTSVKTRLQRLGARMKGLV